jgi:hypothetical protein
MGWFGKKSDENEKNLTLPDLPQSNSNNQIILQKNEVLQDPHMSNINDMEISPLPQLPQHDEDIKQAVSEQVTLKDGFTQGMQPSSFAPLPPPQEDDSPMAGLNFSPIPKIPEKTIRLPIRDQMIRPIKKEERKSVLLSKQKSFETPEKQFPKKSEPIFVRLDKFESTSQALDEIKERIIEIEKYLDKTKELKEQEEKELEDWERELEILKSKLDSIDKNIFSAID